MNVAVVPENLAQLLADHVHEQQENTDAELHGQTGDGKQIRLARCAAGSPNSGST